jgi:Tfp pilus assembly protein PilN
MRPINLIPKEERGLHGGIARTGPFVYILLGSLAVLLIGVVVLVLTSNKVSERESEITTLEAQRSSVSAQVSRLQPYVSFEAVAGQRLEAVTNLADSRFDWQRVIQQLSLVLPPRTSLQSLKASSGGNSGGGQLAVETPALVLDGCSVNQDATAAAIAAMKQIDGVTRVGLSRSSIESESSGGEGECPEGEYEFELTAAFDEAPPSPNTSSGEEVIETGTVESGAVNEAESAPEGEEGGEPEPSGETADTSGAATEGAG